MLLHDLVLILAAALAVVLVFRRLRLPAIAGFIVVGAILGPSGLGWVGQAHDIERFADIGVVLLLFTVGLEFPLREMRRLRRVLTVGGGLQVGVTTAATAAIAAAWGAGLPKAIFLGFLIALSSTAIVLKGLTERGEVDAPHGRLIAMKGPNFRQESETADIPELVFQACHSVTVPFSHRHRNILIYQKDI